MKRFGPQLKMPELKVPTFLADLWWDLWDRRLLPLVALLVVATAAVPFLVGSSKEVPQSSLAALAAARETPAVTSGGRDLAVVQEEPGLRDYRKRLSRLRPTDPFAQRFTAPVVTAHLKSEPLTSSTPAGGGGGGGSSPAPVSVTGSGSGTGAPVVRSVPPSTTGKPHGIRYTFAVDVAITRAKKEPEAGEKPQAWTRKRVLPLTSLPSAKQPVVTYLGMYKGKAVLLVSREVSSEAGEGKCAAGEVEEGACQLIEVEPGYPETFVYGAGETEYTIKVLSVKVVVLGRF